MRKSHAGIWVADALACVMGLGFRRDLRHCCCQSDIGYPEVMLGIHTEYGVLRKQILKLMQIT